MRLQCDACENYVVIVYSSERCHQKMCLLSNRAMNGELTFKLYDVKA